MTGESPSITHVLLVGPEPGEVGGMAGVVRQMFSLDFGGRYCLSCHPTTRSQDVSESLLRRCLRHVLHLRSLHRTIRQSNARIVHIHTCSGFSFFRSALDASVARKAGCRVVLHVHGAAFDEFYRRAGAMTRWWLRRALHTADRVVALSQAWAAELGSIAPKARAVVVENAVMIPPLLPRSRKAGPCRFLLLAKMDEWKGVDDLLNACATLQGTGVGFELTLAGPAGSAGDAPTLRRKIADRQLNGLVRYVGEARGASKEDLFARADAYVQPSHHEGMPLSVLEAMARGLPVIATRVGALPEVIADGHTGRLVPPGRPDALAGVMRELATDASMRCRFGEAARRHAMARFTLERLTEDLAAMYDQLISVRQPLEGACYASPPPGPVAAELFAGLASR